MQTLQGFRLSPQQKHLWLLQQDSLAYCASCAIQIEGNLNVQALKSALNQIVNRHESLRTTFHRQPGIKIPIQVIAESGTLSWNQVNLKELNFQEQSAYIEQLFQETGGLNFKSKPESILSSSLLTLSDNQHILLVTLPAICADSWTLKNLVKEISQTYQAYFKGENLPDEEPVQYIQFSEWQNELLEDEDAETGKGYWRNQAFPNLALPFEGKSQSSARFEPEVYTVEIHPDVAAKLDAIATLYNASFSEVLFACWYTLLWRLTGHSDIAVSTIYSGRKYEELHEVLGLLAKWLPVRCSLQNNFKFSEVLSQLGETLREVDQWQDYFVGEESTDSDNDVVNLPIAFEFEEWSDKYCTGEVSFSIDKQYVCFARFKLKLSCVRKEESLAAEFHYDTELFDQEAIQCIVEQFQTLVESAANNPEAVVSELNIISDRTRDHLLVELNNTQSNYPQTQCIHHLFEQQVERTPDNIAVVFENQQLTYAELNAKANQLAHYLKRQGVGAEVLVGIYAERSLNSIIALLGILKAGGAYLPVDTALPQESLAFRLQDAKVPVLLTQQGLLKREDAQPQTVVYLDADWEIIAQESDANPTSELTPENLAYVLYTSGSTGQPKGVAIEHQQMLNYLHAILEKLELPAGASFAMVSTFAADLGNTVIFPALYTGGCLHIVSQERASDPEALAEYFQRHPIDCLKIVPSHLATLLASSASSSLLPRQCLVLGGEAASWDLIEKVQQYAPNCRILNHYGPTETTVGVLTYPVKSKGDSYNAKTVPIGRAIANTQVYLLDEQLQPVPIGVPGEIYIGGAPLARGYLNRPELTAEKFIPVENLRGQDAHPTRVYKTGDKARYLPDGNIEFLGRVDYQVKIRGFRIELGEIEAVLSQHSGVRQAVVSLSEDESGTKRLIGYVVPKQQQAPNISDLRQFCLNKLPEYMVPSAFVPLKSLPLTPNGKIDRRALPAPEQTRPELEGIYVAPRTSIEAQLAEIWTKVLGLEKVGIHDNFFDLGGHSLLITQLLAKVRDTFKVNLSLRSLFKDPTVANIAKKIAIAQQAKPGSKVEEDAIDLKAEAVLDSTIHPNGIPYNPDIAPTTIFLTGATGFLGAFLLYELLQQTQSAIYCLVRAETIESGKKKIQHSLESYLLWDESLNSRIIPVLGDLSQPLLGLSEEMFQQMASQVDVIYHNGAFVNFTYPYSALKAANVLGTQEVLRLASQIKAKPVHFISTISVVVPNNRDVSLVREQDSLDEAKIPSNGYTQSKWVAEKLVTIARERGLPICIYRPGRISGHSQTGACNPGDHTYRMIKGCIQLGSIPNQDIQLNFSPVDYVSQAIVSLSNQKESIGKAFHLVNPQPLPLKEMANYIRSLGYPIELVGYEQWRSQLINTADSSENALYPLLSIFAEETSNTQSKNSAIRKLDCQNTLTGLAKTSISCPPVDAELFSTYFSYLIQTGFLNSPALQLQTT
ncbi:amino acid adenylation domain-containing protein [Microcoleus sp. ZQ-A2]|nr:amino acid adenylation domain-containing protein [Microcoleus sp. FACHB-1]